MLRISNNSGIGMLPVIKQLNATYRNRTMSDHAMIDGHKMLLDKGDSLSLSTIGKFEEKEKRIFEKNISKGDIVVDVGAHIGLHTLTFARIVGDEGQVFAFEPDPRNFKTLKENININNYRNVALENKAVSDGNEASVKFYCHKDSSADSSLGKRKNAELEEITIETITLDVYFKNIPNIVFIKIDVEGSELLVLKGMQNIVKNNKNLKIMIEYSPSAVTDFDGDPNENMKFLSEQGFKFTDCDKDETKFFDYIELVKAYEKNRKVVNFFCVRA